MKTAPQIEAVRRYAASAGLGEVDDSCDADTLAAAAEFWRIVAQRRAAAAPETGSSLEAELRSANLIQQIACTPSNGLAWAELAAVERARHGWSSKVLRYLSLSQRYAPYEGLALATRLDVLSGAGSQQASELQRRDLEASLNYAAPREAAIQMAQLTPARRAWAEEYLATLSKSRGDAIRNALAGLKAAAVN